MSDIKYQGKVTNFWKLLKDHKIEIPIIQRDYAQGREDKKEIRNNFLNALLQSVNTDTNIKLDFIYGSLENGAFQPLDGQQRLTTLFLLHWYAALKDQLLNKDTIDILKRFTYETRISSREFCNTLVSKPISITKRTILGPEIIDSSWFFLSWKKDPTIEAMLRTIDDIHKYFFNVENLWDKLISEESLISFYHIELEDIGLTDDLYIKMNARGKLLSPFENFKASFQKHINDEQWDSDKDFINTFAMKIDSKWTDLFWKHRKKNRIDEAFIRFISTISMCRQSINKIENRLLNISKLQDKPNLIKPDLFSKDDFIYLCTCFDIYCEVFNNDIDINLNFSLFQHKSDDSIFSGIVYEGQGASYTQKVLFFAQTEYLRRVTEFKSDTFLDWMRVVRNVISRGDVSKNGNRPTIIRSPQTFDGVINLIHELASGCENIYNYLSTTQVKSSFAKEQIEEEILKSKLIVKDTKNRISIFNIEDTNLLQGKISFALFCINYTIGEDLNRSKIGSVQKIIIKYFNKDADVNNDLRRALLTISDQNGNYNYYGYWWSFWNVVSANKRCLLDKNLRELEFFIYATNNEYQIYLKKLIFKLMDNDLKQISNNFTPPVDMPKWKVRLIKESNLLDNKCESNHIAIPDNENCCYLLKSMRPRDIDGCNKIE